MSRYFEEIEQTFTDAGIDPLEAQNYVDAARQSTPVSDETLLRAASFLIPLVRPPDNWATRAHQNAQELPFSGTAD